jgi:hypothetical protein
MRYILATIAMEDEERYVQSTSPSDSNLGVT